MVVPASLLFIIFIATLKQVVVLNAFKLSPVNKQCFCFLKSALSHNQVGIFSIMRSFTNVQTLLSRKMKSHGRLACGRILTLSQKEQEVHYSNEVNR